MPDALLERARKRSKFLRECKYEKEYRKNTLENLKYFTGDDQGWDEEGHRAALKEQKRPALTLNRISSILYLMMGARPKTEARFIGVEDNDLDTSDYMNACKDHVEDHNSWDYYENDWFKNGIVLSGSVVEILPDDSRDIKGEVGLDIIDRFECYFDPKSKKKDRSDGEDFLRVITMSPSKAKRIWPDKKKKIDELVGHKDGNDNNVDTVDENRDDGYKDSQTEYYDAESNELSVYYYWYKEWKFNTKIIDLDTMEIFDSPLTANEVNEALKNDPEPMNVAVKSVQYPEIRYIVFAHETVFETGKTPWDRPDGKRTKLSDNIPYLCFEPDRIFAGTTTNLISIIDPLKDPQKFHNRLATAVLHILGTSANSGWEYEKSALSTENKEKLQQYGSTPGVNLEWEDGALSGQKVRKIQPTQMPQGHMAEAKEMSSEMLNISGVDSLVSTESLGKGASGKAIDLKQRQGGNIISWVYDSFRFYQHLLTWYVKDAIQVMYDYEKVVRIKGTRPRPIKVNETIYDEHGGISEILNDVTSGDFDIKMTDREVSPTERTERFREFTSMARDGLIQLPPEVMLKVVAVLMDDPVLKYTIEDEMTKFMQEQQQQMIAQQGAPQGPPQGGQQMVA